MSRFDKDPDDRLDYTFDWTAWLAKVADSIVSFALNIPSGITSNQDSFDANTVTVWLLTGTAKEKYRVACKITTAGGRIAERTMLINVVER